MFSQVAWDFVVQMLSGIVAVFVGIWLALIVERRRRSEDTAEREAAQMVEFERATDSILGSVVKNTAEARRILRLVGSARCPRLLHADFETAVWYASHSHFTGLCRNVDQRVIFSQFFDDVRRLSAFVDFRTDLHVQITTQRLDLDEGEVAALAANVDKHLLDLDEGEVATLAANVDKHLLDLAEDLRFCGVLLVTDHGKPVHKRLMGIYHETEA